MRVFPDTNVLVSAFATRGLCADLLRLVTAEHDLLVGEVVLVELDRVLRRRIRLPGSTIADIDTFLRDFEVIEKPSSPASTRLPDPDDAWILASAVAGHADVLVTGDRDLLDAADRCPLRVTDPRGFWDELRTTRR